MTYYEVSLFGIRNKRNNCDLVIYYNRKSRKNNKCKIVKTSFEYGSIKIEGAWEESKSNLPIKYY